MLSTILQVLTLSAVVAALPTTPSAWTVGQLVSTSSGSVQGHAAPWPAKSDVSEYLGIPYAYPPLGPLRFAPPKSLKSNQTWPGDKFSADCVQFPPGAATQALAEGNGLDTVPAFSSYAEGMGGPGRGNPHKYDEDCLSINVWTKPQTGEKAKAVLMWIYGGGFLAGASNGLFYNGARIANDEDVVVVSFNYRIGFMGFSHAPGQTQNVGLLDQRMAVEWARDNVAAFGGDPKRITLFGESAGATSVDWYSYAWDKDPIVHGLIAQSVFTYGPTGTTRPTAPWYEASKRVGCGGPEAGAEQSVACMRNKTVGELMSAALYSVFMPVADEKTVFASPRTRAASGAVAKIPMLVGSNDNELTLFSSLLTTLPIIVAAYNAGPGKPFTPPDTSLLKAFFKGNLATSAISYLNDIIFTCPVSDSAVARVNNGIKIWRYRYMAAYENTAIDPGMGAYHSAEVPIVFGATERRRGASKDTEDETKLMKVMMHAWAEFAKDPNTGLTKLGWPAYEFGKDTLVKLGEQNSSIPAFGPAGQYDGNCQLAGNIADILEILVSPSGFPPASSF